MKGLIKVVTRRRKRLGRGYGSGKGGHTVGRGQKGQKARTKVDVLFEGMKVKKSLLRRLPIQRGKGKFKTLEKSPMVLNLARLSVFGEGSMVNLSEVIKAKLVDAKEAKSRGVKILGQGNIEKKLQIDLPISKSAALKVVKAGGKIIE
ncbi:50S ribosomal protein L15 [Candidatus Woesebacteria bacterium RIFOXYB1_FULL_38_16]|uniref:Large ribosomal subunit protein uL15 n=1 Tax=Candidatus Woesebacteria bacterium RIFOXYB1_FULL_38_16 TaxID=1802538 RepID=A0A1F8CVF8_9BACT|nr:MAG: 50S ribosomal protein L15 [Candidatus Woesebacteria bacterium RIFOXYA1_FULL_38_9]OGM80056.1 MAG: 50S ribosomal protein L15 [Candidatus Woesebacteria bacterium RIFOXYB1_FULL_38_16]